VAVANADDEVVMADRNPHARTVTFGLRGRAAADYALDGDDLVLPDGEVLVSRRELPRDLPHDIANALAASATALEGGATRHGVRSVLRSFGGLAHRVQLVAEANGVRYVDDSKATAPHATLAAVAGFESVVLLAGGRNKGLDLSALAAATPSLRAVVAIGEAADEVRAAFVSRCRVVTATSMAEAVALATAEAEPGDVVLLSPGCASFDWYGSYAERGDDFARCVHSLLSMSSPEVHP
jgi:UDP-N-acetylmuramoylalanine--D-glutamate ligase